MESKNIQLIKDLIIQGRIGTLFRAAIKKIVIQYIHRPFEGKALVGPILGGLLVSHKCNLKCAYCSLWKRNEENPATTEQLIYCVDELAKEGVLGIGIMGGEPTLRNDIVAIINRIHHHKIVSSVVTNGTTMTEEMAKQYMSTGLGFLNFSIDSFVYTIHDACRGEGVWQKALSGAQIAMKIKKENSYNTKIGINIVINSTNCRTVLDTIHWAKIMGFDFAYLLGLDIESASNDICKLTDEDKKIIIEFLPKIKSEFGEFVTNSQDYIDLVLNYQLKNIPLPYDCLAAYTSRYIDYKGYKYPCNYYLQRGIKNNFWYAPKKCRICYWPCQQELNLSMGCKL